MFESDFNIIYGAVKTGRTKFLLDVSLILKDNGLNVFFLGFSPETKLDLSSFNDYRIITSNDDFNITKIIEVVKEITESRGYDYLFIDDVDYIPNHLIQELNNIKVKKVATCLDFATSKFSNSIHYNLNDISVDMIAQYINSIIRDKKINSILDDKSR